MAESVCRHAQRYHRFIDSVSTVHFLSLRIRDECKPFASINLCPRSKHIDESIGILFGNSLLGNDSPYKSALAKSRATRDIIVTAGSDLSFPVENNFSTNSIHVAISRIVVYCPRLLRRILFSHRNIECSHLNSIPFSNKKVKYVENAPLDLPSLLYMRTKKHNCKQNRTNSSYKQTVKCQLSTCVTTTRFRMKLAG